MNGWHRGMTVGSLQETALEALEESLLQKVLVKCGLFDVCDSKFEFNIVKLDTGSSCIG